MASRSKNVSESHSELSAEAARFAAGAFSYTAVIALFTKVTRAALLAHSTHSHKPLFALPLVLGSDLILVASAALFAHLLARLPPRPLRISLGVVLLALLATVHIFDIGAHELTGSPLTYQRLRGDEGATFRDIGLVATRELVLGFGSLALLYAMLWPMLRFAPRFRWLQRAAALRSLALLLIIGLCSNYAAMHYLRRGFGLHTQSVIDLLRSIFDEDAYEARELTKPQWDKLLKPAIAATRPEHAPPALGSKRPKNVVVFLAEGIAFEHTGFAAQDKPNPTPHLTERVKKEGLLLSRYYAHWHASNQAIFSVVCSSLPPMTGDIMRKKPRIDCGEFSEVMREHGLHAGLFHAGHFSFYNKLALLGRRGYETELDAEDLMLRNKKWQPMLWGTDDRAMVDATLKWVDSLPKGDHFAALMISIAPHYPFELPSSWTPRPFKGNSELSRYLNGVYYIDDVFEELVRGFEARGLADDTLFVFLGDHGIQINEPARATPGRRSFYEPSLHVPFVMLNPRLFPATLGAAQRSSDRLAGHMDLLPTILDALGEDSDPRHHGQSVFRDDRWPRRLFFAAFGAAYIGFIENDFKFMHEPRASRTEYYDLRNDPNELHDLSDQYPARMRDYSGQAVAIAQGSRAQIEVTPVLDEKVSIFQIYSLFRHNVVARIERGRAKSVCTPDAKGDNRICPGAGAIFSQKDQNIMGEQRRCLEVRVPEGATVRLRVEDPNTLSMLNATVATVSKKDPKNTLFLVGTEVDGQHKPFLSVDNTQAYYINHARGRKYVEYTFSNTHKGQPDSVCLQLAKLD